MEKILHRANSRGRAEHGWLHSHHTFSFASYFNPERMGFGKLRVLNDDFVAPAQGFGTHPHDNMEIVSIPLAGSLRHKDSMGNQHVIRNGEIQIMSAGTGIAHSEYNNSDTEQVNFLQIWVLPKKLDIQPRYGQRLFDLPAKHNRFQTVVAPDERDGSLWINQDAYFSLADLDAGITETYTINSPHNGVYIFLLDGQVRIAGETLDKRDALGLAGVPSIEIQALEKSELLCIEVPMA